MPDGVDMAHRDLLHEVAEGTAGVVGDAFLRTLVKQVGEAFGPGVCWVSELLEGRASARALACWPSEALPEGEEYPLEGTPCQLIHEQAVVNYTSGVPAAFPNDPFLAEYALDGYLALACRTGRGAVVGYLAVTSERPLDANPTELHALRIFASWVGEEIDRRVQESRLRAREVELAASRARVVEAADEERRRIGRDLHDGVQQRLVAMTQRVDIALRALHSDPQQAEAMLRDAREQASLAGKELRELSHGLHPVGLSERGLEGALRLLVGRSTVPLRLLTMPDRRLPAPVETTVYYLVSEALTNASKHAQATEVTVDTALSARTLQVTIADDGIGGVDPAGGTGLRGLEDRLIALGGTLGVFSPPGTGTTLIADIPLAPFRDARDPFIELGYEGDGGQGKRMISRILDGTKKSTISLAREWDLEGGPPRIGQVLPVQDHTGTRYASVVVTRTAVMPLSLVDEETAATSVGEPITIEQWRAERWRFYEGCREEIAVLLDEPDWRLTEHEPMVVTSFQLIT